MGTRIVLGVLLGGLVGFGVGYIGQRAGGTCPLTCNPYGGTIVGALIGAMIASSIGARTPSFTPSPHLVTIESADAFEQKVLKAEAPALVEFYTERCGFCRKQEPVLHSLADRFADKAVVAKVDAGRMSDLAKKHEIRGVPTLILFRDGKEIERLVGYHPETELGDMLSRHLPVQ